MGLQLIFVLETNRKCNSDWIYISETIERFYIYDQAHVKISKVYMDGKGKYKNKKSDVLKLMKKYAGAAANNESRVFFCFDCDDYDSNPVDFGFLNETMRFCNENGFKHVWFCKDIERVYLGRKVPDSKKKIEASKFSAQNLIDQVEKSKLSASSFGANRSNLLAVIDSIIDNMGGNTLIKRKQIH